MSESTTKPRWFRFSLRFLLLLVTIICVSLGWKVNQVRNQQAVAAKLVQAEMALRFDEHPFFTKGSSVARLQGPPGPKWLRRILGDEFFTQLTDIDAPPLAGHPVSDDEHRLIGSLSYLERLSIERERISVDGLAHLAKLSTMHFLWLSNVTDAEVSTIAKLKQVEVLTLFGSPITDHSLESLVRLPRLIQLDLPGTNISDSGIETVVKLRNLKHLDISRTRITDAGLKLLSKKRNLKTLNIRNTQVTDAGLKSLVDLRNLKGLDICATQVTDTGLKSLQMMPNLVGIRLYETKVTAEGVMELRTALPGCTVDWSIKSWGAPPRLTLPALPAKYGTDNE